MPKENHCQCAVCKVEHDLLDSLSTQTARAPKPLRKGANGELWEPFWEPQGGEPDVNLTQVVEGIGRP